MSEEVAKYGKETDEDFVCVIEDYMSRNNSLVDLFLAFLYNRMYEINHNIKKCGCGMAPFDDHSAYRRFDKAFTELRTGIDRILGKETVMATFFQLSAIFSIRKYVDDLFALCQEKFGFSSEDLVYRLDPGIYERYVRICTNGSKDNEELGYELVKKLLGKKVTIEKNI